MPPYPNLQKKELPKPGSPFIIFRISIVLVGFLNQNLLNCNNAKLPNCRIAELFRVHRNQKLLIRVRLRHPVGNKLHCLGRVHI
jgi:hypothetical protein